jgi:hypothetical protein
MELEYPERPSELLVPHYHGETVRKFFLAGAIIMLLTLPFFNDLLPVPLFISIPSILVFGVGAGLINPKYISVALLNLAIAAGALLVFEYFAVVNYHGEGIMYTLFWIDQFLALNFLVAFYYSVKTVRGMLTRSK